jgi:hypothetical protein
VARGVSIGALSRLLDAGDGKDGWLPVALPWQEGRARNAGIGFDKSELVKDMLQDAAYFDTIG